MFVALLPPPTVIDELAEFLAPYRAAWPDLRWERRALFHVTVAFLGEIDEERVEPLASRLEGVAGRFPPLNLSFAGGGAFPSGGAYARVMWPGLYGDRRALAGLAASVGAAARQAGLLPVGTGRGQGSGGPGEHKTFRPHLTLARCRRPMDVRPLVEALSAFAGSPWTAGHLHLMRSHQTPQVRYETFRAWPFGDRTRGGDVGPEAVGTADDSRAPVRRGPDGE
jgi:2'-5' RNA ligase